MKTVDIRTYGKRAFTLLENSRWVRKDGIVAIIDLDRSCYSRVTRDFLARREKDGRLIVASDGLPKSFIVYDDGIREESYLSVFGAEAIKKRVKTEG